MWKIEEPEMPRFRVERATELAAFIVQACGGRTDFLTLLKLMYHTERHALEQYDWPITFDKFVRMDNGPVLSTVYNLLKGDEGVADIQSTWNQFLVTDPPHHVRLVDQPVLVHLSAAQHAIVQEVIEAERGKSGPMLSTESHGLPEWSDPKGSSVPIPYRDLLGFLGKTDDEIQAIFDGFEGEVQLEQAGLLG